MSKLLLAASIAAIFSSSAFAQENFYDWSASEQALTCSLWLGEPSTPEESVAAGECWRTTADWLYDTQRADETDGSPDSIGWQPSQEMLRRAECAARIILAHATEDTPVADILAAEFDGACKPQTM